MRKLILTLTASCALLLGAAGPAATAEPVNLGIASFGQKSSWYAYAVGLAEILRGVLPDGSTVDTPPEGGGTKNPLLVGAGKFDLAFGMAVVSGWAKNGEVVYKEPMDGLRALVGGFDQYYLGILANEPGVTATVDEYVTEQKPDLNIILRGRGSIGGVGGAQILEFAGASEEQVKERGGNWIDAGSFDVVLSQLSAGNADLWIHTITVGHPAMTEAAINNDVSLLEPSDEVNAKMESEFGWKAATLPAGSFEGQDRDLTLPGTSTNLFVHADMPEELAYTITKALCDNVERFKSQHKALSKFDCQAGIDPSVAVLPLHDGAKRYFEERGWL